MKKLLIVFLLFPLFCHGFIPPIGTIIKEIFDARKSGIFVELSYKHHVELTPGTTVTIDESMIYGGGKAYFLWKSNNHVPVYGVLDRKSYLIGNDRKLNQKSFLYSKYLGASSSEDFKEQLIAEQFIRRDQLLQYKPGFTFEGDPDSWQVQENYLRHPDIQLKRLSSQVAIAVKGMEEGQNQRAVYFDLKTQGILKFEWKEGSTVSSWNFSDFNTYQDGLFPRQLRFEQNGSELVNSELVQVRGLKEPVFQNTLKSWQKTGSRNAATGNLEEALKVLLSFR